MCLSSDFNDHISFSQLPTGLGPDDFVSLYHGQVEVRGPNIIETAPLASTRTGCSADCSRVGVVEHPGGVVTLSYMLGRGDAPTTIGGIAVDAFRAELIGEVDAAQVSSGVYEIRRDAAVFALSGQALGSSALVGVTNSTAIRFRRGRTAGSWDFDPFQLSYTDERNNVYDFFVGATRWQ